MNSDKETYIKRSATDKYSLIIICKSLHGCMRLNCILQQKRYKPVNHKFPKWQWDKTSFGIAPNVKSIETTPT